MDENFAHVNLIKIVVLGDSNIGKSCLLNRYVNNCFTEKSEPSFPDLITVKTSVDGIDAKLYIFESVGKESYNCFTEINYRNSNAVIICVDPTNFNSYLKMNYWLHEITNDELARECKIYICSTKFDLIESSEQSFALEALNLKAKSMKTQFFVTSSKTGEGIENMFNQIVKDMIKTLEYDCISSNEIEVTKSLPDTPVKAKQWKQWLPRPRSHTVADCKW